MKIGFSCYIDQDPLIRTLGSNLYEIFRNHMCVLSYHDSRAQICARLYARLIQEDQTDNAKERSEPPEAPALATPPGWVQRNGSVLTCGCLEESCVRLCTR